MPDAPNTADTADLAVTEYDAGRDARMERRAVVGSDAPLPPEVGLAQKGDGEDAVVRRETEIRGDRGPTPGGRERS